MNGNLHICLQWYMHQYLVVYLYQNQLFVDWLNLNLFIVVTELIMWLWVLWFGYLCCAKIFILTDSISSVLKLTSYDMFHRNRCSIIWMYNRHWCQWDLGVKSIIIITWIWMWIYWWIIIIIDIMSWFWSL